MRLSDLKVNVVDYPLRVNWAISRNQSSKKRVFYFQINDQILSECAPNIRYGETEKLIRQQMRQISEKYGDVTDGEQIAEILQIEMSKKNICHSLAAGIEMAFIHRSKKEHVQMKCSTSMSVPIMSFDEFKVYFREFDLASFKLIKFKSNKNLPITLIEYLLKKTDTYICIDYNEALSSLNEFEEHESLLGQIDQLSFIEQPFPADRLDLYKEFKQTFCHELILDETIHHQNIGSQFLEICDGVNIKVMKSGGLQRAKIQLDQAKKLGLKTMVGCMIESSLSISRYVELGARANYCDLDGHLFLEGDPFKMVTMEKGVIST